MSISMHAASAPRIAETLRNLAGILAKAEAFALARKVEPSVMLGLRLYPNMFPLVRQVQIASDNAKGVVARLAGMEVPRYEDNEASFAELQQRIQKTIAFIESVPAAAINGSEERDIHMKLGPNEMHFKGMQYLFGHALPNFYFHVVTAYAILRHNGVEIGKSDYIGTV